MLRLLLLRHAKSDWPEGVPDPDRPLAARGRRGAKAIGAYMVEEALLPARAIVSPARRTIETWEIATKDWPTHVQPAYEHAIYEAPAENLLKLIREQEALSPLLLVGHNPGMEELAALLLRREQRAKVLPKYPTGALAVIDMPIESWAELRPGCGTLERFVTPRALGVEKGKE
ncbi:histidine phosphatase family protein [Starkeya koreensis]|uniref:Histidine phosphatase family protein n=1 Tax=Ancylobacter koreensis TaxID=266121 RepID=A0ABT0DPE8_9HYPH|nr:histidine phosphatase family protein [Ancylobacter koreensis]MCK0209155.1 histidine phosphatase family protein [Ancylobacter koreensis]